MKAINLRLPDDLHAAVKALAASEHRSMHAEILHILADRVSGADSPPA
jgi:plasmid stability protein